MQALTRHPEPGENRAPRTPAGSRAQRPLVGPSPLLVVGIALAIVVGVAFAVSVLPALLVVLTKP